MFHAMFKRWFQNPKASYSEFMKSPMNGDMGAMNYYMNKVAFATFSYFDVGGENGESTEPERFYHGFVFEGKKC